MSVYTVRVEHGKRRPDAKIPESGPVTPPYLHHPSEVSHVKVVVDPKHPDGRDKADHEMDNEALHTAYDMAGASGGQHHDNDMVTKTEIIHLEASRHDPWYASATDEEIDQHHDPEFIRSLIGHYTAPSGTKYRLVNHTGRMVTAHVMPSGRRAGGISWFGGKKTEGNSLSGTIHKVVVSGPHRRKGLATAMLNHARATNPKDDILHSTALTDDGKAWAAKVATVTYRSGGIGHVGDDRSVVGLVPIHKLLPFREHEGDQHDGSEKRVNDIASQLKTPDDINEPLMLEYDHKNKLGSLGEGNHRLEAAQRAGLTHVPVRVHGRSNLSYRKQEGMTHPLDLTTKFTGGMGEDYVPPDIHPHHFDALKDDVKKEGHYSRTWRPHQRIFGPTKGQEDPRLFASDHQMLPDVRHHLLAKLTAFMDKHGWHDWYEWGRMYLAGSEASDWYGNNDFDVLVGIDYDAFKAATGSTLHPEQITDDFNKAFRADWNDESWRPPFDSGIWHLTGYVNPNSYDIRKIKPYAAYDVGADTWAVKPVQVPEDWGPSKFPESTWKIAEHYADEIDRISHLDPKTRQQYAKRLWEHIHTDRQRAFSDNGTGVFDVGNVAEKYLDQRPDHPLALLVEMVHAGSAEPEEDHDNLAENHAVHGVANHSLGRRLEPKHHLGSSTPVEPLSEAEQEARLAPGTFKEQSNPQGVPTQHLIDGAAAYAKTRGLPSPHEGIDYSQVKTTADNTRRIGRAYQALPEHDEAAVPHYDAMRQEIHDQYHHMTNNMGIKVHLQDTDPYPNSKAMMEDVHQNKRIKVLSTKATGSHPYLSDDENDKFRAIHDVFGHAATGRGFDKHGEEAAFQAHSRMFSPMARPAMETETRGQNHFYNLNGKFAQQKVALLPKGVRQSEVPTDSARTAAFTPQEVGYNDGHDFSRGPGLPVVEGGKGRPRRDAPQGPSGDRGADQVAPGSVAPGDGRGAGAAPQRRLGLIEHPGAKKDLKRLHPQLKKKYDTVVQALVSREGHPSTHRLQGGALAKDGWNATSLDFKTRITHKTIGDDIHVGHVGTHEYEEAARRLKGYEGSVDPRFEGTSLKQDDDGKWYVTTHRARSKSYDTPEDIPQSKVDFIESTGKVRHAPGPNGEKPDGIMVAIVPPRRVLKTLPVPEDGEDPDNIHVTVAYLGKVSEHTKDQLADLPELIQAWAETQPKLDARVQGVGTFVNEGSHVLWAAVDMPGVNQMHVDLVDYLDHHGFEVKQNHSFTPHLTLSYAKSHFRFMPKIEPTEFRVREIWCCVGGRWESFPLRG